MHNSECDKNRKFNISIDSHKAIRDELLFLFVSASMRIYKCRW
uniref:Uncharacterized protein n=1 Tax=Setaria italica TaxID=4555 RepID=K4AN70_SETIT